MTPSVSSIDIAFCVNDAYADYIGVTIKSLCVNSRTPRVRLHVLSDGLSDRSLRRLQSVVKPYSGVDLNYYRVDDSQLRGLKDTWSIYTWYRVLLPSILPASIDRVLYLDADTLVEDDLAWLWTVDMTDKAIGCAIDVLTHDDETFARCRYPKSDLYVCAGVMLMNLAFWRQQSLADRIVKFGFDHNDEIRFPDQDTINILCRNNKVVLPMRFGIQEGYFRDERFHTSSLRSQLLECIDRPAIVHYAGCAPWIAEFDWSVMHSRWMRYCRMLPYRVRPRFMTKGINGLKVRVHRLFHSDPRKCLTEQAAKAKFLNL